MVGIGHLLRREVVGEVPIAPTPSLEGNAVLAGSLQTLLDGLVWQVRQLVQFLNEARPTAFADADYGDARVVYVVKFVIVVRVETRYAGGGERPCGSAPYHRDLS